MPCRVDDPGPSQAERRLSDEVKQLKEKIKRLERLEPLLCGACRVLERLDYDFDESPELSEWWDRHKKKDEARLKRERKARLKAEWEEEQIRLAVAKPIADLSKEEKALLKKAGIL